MSTILTLNDPRTARRYYEAGVWRDETLYGLVERHARERPDAYSVRDSRHRITWRHLRAWVDALAAELHAAGLRRGQRVSVWLPNRIENVVVFLACSRNGYVCNPSLHQNYTTAEVVQLMERIRSATLFAQPGYGSDACEEDVFAAAHAIASMRRVWWLADGAAEATEIPDAARFPRWTIEPPHGSLPPVDVPLLSMPEFVLQEAAERPGKPALIDGLTGRRLTYGELAEGGGCPGVPFPPLA